MGDIIQKEMRRPRKTQSHLRKGISNTPQYKYIPFLVKCQFLPERSNKMEEDIVEEIMRESKIHDKYFCQVLINICKYYKIKSKNKILKLVIESQVLDFDNILTTN